MTNVNKRHNDEEVDKIKKKIAKKAIELCLFLSLANLPYITLIQVIGIDTFLDTFENPDYYLYFSEEKHSIEPYFQNGCYILLQKSSHSDFSVEQGDVIMYFKDDGGTALQRVCQINCIGSVKKYHFKSEINNLSDVPLYENQIIGKVISIVDKNIWNTISMKIWDISIHNFNIKALFSKP